MAEPSWYEPLRAEWRPENVRLLLIGESAPDPGDGELRFFYAPTLSAHDNLFCGVIHALYDATALEPGTEKKPWLERLRADGVFLIDLVPHPINKGKKSLRRREWSQYADSCVAAALDLRPDGVVVCLAGVFKVLETPLRRANLPLLHSRPIPFPVPWWRQQFVAGVRTAVGDIVNARWT